MEMMFRRLLSSTTRTSSRQIVRLSRRFESTKPPKDENQTTDSATHVLSSLRAKAHETFSHLPHLPKDSQGLKDSIRQLDKSMQYQGYNGLRWMVGIFACAVGSMYIFRDDVKEGIGSTSAEITYRTLGDENVQREAQNLAQGVVYQLLNDDKALELTTEFLNHLLAREESRIAVVRLLGNVAAQQVTQDLLQDLFVRILTEPSFVAQTSLFFQDVFQRDSTKLALKNLFTALFADEQFQETTAKFFQYVLYTETFQAAINRVAADSVHSVLNDEEVGKHAVTWAQTVLMEPTLHTKAGDAIWGAVASAFVPRIFTGKSSTRDTRKATQDAVNFDEALKNLRKEEIEAMSKKETETLNRTKSKPLTQSASGGGESNASSSSSSTYKSSFVDAPPPTMDEPSSTTVDEDINSATLTSQSSRGKTPSAVIVSADAPADSASDDGDEDQK